MKLVPYALLFACLTLFISCSTDDDSPVAPEESVSVPEEVLDAVDNEIPESVEDIIVDLATYDLASANGSGITGKAAFTRDVDGNTTILIELENTNTEEHPAFIRFNSADEGGEIAITLTVCTCSIGTTVVTQLDDGTPIDFDDLLKLDGHISIKGSPEDIDTVVSTADIGINAN